MVTKSVNRKSLTGWLVVILVVIAGVIPQFPAPASSSDNASIVSQRVAEDELYWDNFFANQMEAFDVYGAEMVIVQGNEILFAKGYGFADAALRTPLDPQSTIVRSGSIAKTLTALSVLQLADQGKLDLDADVNDYLTTFEVPDTFPEPVTARQLINMTAGFDTRAIGIRARSREEVKPLGEYLAERMPPRVLPPGRYRRYNDHELVLAGYLVEVISGMPYERYVRQHIFEPLEMHDSSVLLPDAQLERAARGYPVGGGSNAAYPFSYYYLNTAPGAGFNTTAQDVAHYLMAILQSGAYTQSDGSRVHLLGAEAARSMLETAFLYDPHLPGSANSFDERFFKGRRFLRKLGGAPGMQNDLILMPESKLGFYLFTNTDGTGLRNHWEQAVAERYLAETDSPGVQRVLIDKNQVVDVDTAKFSGLYQEISDATSETTIVQVQALVDPDLVVKVDANPDGSLQVWGRRYAPVTPAVFQDSASGDTIAFEIGPNGKANFLFQARTAHRRMGWLETPGVQMGLLGFAVLVFLSSTGRLVFQFLKGSAARNKLSVWLPGLVSSLSLVFLVALVFLLLPVATGGDIWQFSFEPSFGLRFVLALPAVIALLAALLLIETSTAWWKGRHSRLTRLFHTFVLFGVAALLFFLNTWNLLGWRF
jgi:CubicO group peptidase (beta-lactamase class C family)